METLQDASCCSVSNEVKTKMVYLRWLLFSLIILYIDSKHFSDFFSVNRVQETILQFCEM